MKQLILLRHAQAEPHTGKGDVYRALTPQGVSEARRAAQQIAANGWKPDLLLFSPANRTRQTASIVAAPAPQKPLMLEEPRLYHATVEQILSVLQATPIESRQVLVVAHNPGISDCITTLLPEPTRSHNLRTGQWTSLLLPIQDWRYLSPGIARRQP